MADSIEIDAINILVVFNQIGLGALTLSEACYHRKRVLDVVEMYGNAYVSRTGNQVHISYEPSKNDLFHFKKPS